MDRNRLEEHAGKPEWYPQADKAVQAMVSAANSSSGWRARAHTRMDAARIVRDVLAALTGVEISGFMSAGDEHEFARWALIADELSNQ